MFPSGWEWLAVKDVANKGLVESAASELPIAVDQEHS